MATDKGTHASPSSSESPLPRRFFACAFFVAILLGGEVSACRRLSERERDRDLDLERVRER